MNLLRVFAYQVEPRRTTGGPIAAPPGGRVPIGTDIEDALAIADKRWRRERRIAVDLRVDPATRTNETRDLLIEVGFGTDANALAAATNLATRLSGAMDLRSAPCLCIIAVEGGEHDQRRVTVWTFPRDDAFQFQGATGTASVKLLTDVFSQTSNLRKAALFEGKNRKNDFVSGRVLDFQVNYAGREVADFWIGRFLDAALGISGESGTRMLATSLRKAWETTQDPNEREQLFVAATAIRQSSRTRWSLREFADEYLQGDVKERVVRFAPNQDALNSSFDFQRQTFDRTVHFRVFRLDSGVYVSSPFDEVGRTVRISGDREKHLTCEGTVVEEKVRTRA
jgi:hypothetical protein